MPEDMDYLVEGADILAGAVMDEVEKLIDQLNSEQATKPKTAKHYV